MNTLKNSNVRFVSFFEKGVWYAVGLEFNIVVTGNTKESAILELFRALNGYVESLVKLKGIREEKKIHLLNQKSEPEYEILWKKIMFGEKISSAYKFVTAGMTPAHA